jgi:hypothetical protein
MARDADLVGDHDRAKARREGDAPVIGIAWRTLRDRCCDAGRNDQGSERYSYEQAHGHIHRC